MYILFKYVYKVLKEYLLPNTGVGKVAVAFRSSHESVFIVLDFYEISFSSVVEPIEIYNVQYISIRYVIISITK